MWNRVDWIRRTAMNKLLSTLEKQNELIRMQSSIIDELFLQLLQHISVSEVEGLPYTEEIKRAAKMKEDIGI